MQEVRTAQRLDPLSLAINTDVGFHHYYNGRYAEAIAQLQSVLGMQSGFALAHLWLCLDPRWKTLRSDPRFARLVERMKFPG
jgi:hypothetical protein